MNNGCLIPLSGLLIILVLLGCGQKGDLVRPVPPTASLSSEVTH